MDEPGLATRFVHYGYAAGYLTTVSLAVLGYPRGGVGLRQRTLLRDLRPISRVAWPCSGDYAAGGANLF